MRPKTRTMKTNNKGKKNTSILSQSVILVVAIFLLSLSGCKKDAPLTAQEKVTAMLTSATWVTNTVTIDGVDYSVLYNNFSIKFDKSTYTTTSGGPVWNASGTWVFINAEATLMKMDGVREVTINSITGDFLELSFQWEQNTFEPGRSKSVKGKQKFKLKKKL